MPEESTGLAGLGNYTNRPWLPPILPESPPPSAPAAAVQNSQVQTTPQQPAAPPPESIPSQHGREISQTVQVPPSNEPEPPPSTAQPSPGNFQSDILKAFQQSQTTTPENPPIPEAKPDTPPKALEILPEPPEALKERGKKAWVDLRTQFHDEIRKRETEISDLRRKLDQGSPEDRAEIQTLRDQLQKQTQILQQIAVQHSPLFRESVIDKEDFIKARVLKISEGTTLTPQDVALLLGDDMRRRDEIMDSHQISSYRKSQLADLLNRWDQVQETRGDLLTKGQESQKEFLRRNKEAEQAKQAEYYRNMEKTFETQMQLIAPTLETLTPIDGNDKWAEQVAALKANSRQIYMGQNAPELLAAAAILAPQARLYQQYYRAAMQRVGELERQVQKMRGLSPTVSERGTDLVEAPASDANKGFMQVAMERFAKEGMTP